MEELKLFLITFSAALAGVIPPGLVNMTVAKTSVEKGKRSGVFVAVGACTIVLFQAGIAILLAKYIFGHPFVDRILLRTGLVVFILMGIYFFVTAKKKKKDVKISKKSSAKSYLKGIMIATLNIFPIPYFVAISTAFNANSNYEYNWVSITCFALAAALGNFVTLYVYAVSFAKIEKRAKAISKYSNYFMALLMLVLVIITLVRIYYNNVE